MRSTVCPRSGRHFLKPHWANATRPKRYENSLQVQDLTRVLEAVSLTQRQLSEREVHPGRSSDQWKSWQDSCFRDEEWTASAAVGNWWADAMSSWNSGEEERGPPLDETMGASWIAQIGEEGVSETEAVDSFIAMNAQRKRTWAQAHELKQAARKDC